MFQKLTKYTYKMAGVDIKKADNIIKEIASEDSNFKNFAGIFNFKNDKLVSCCDGIGSKIIPLIKYNMPDIIANDLIAMNINDMVTLNAKPLFFLDYIATNTLDNNLDKIIKNTISHLKNILFKYNCTLLGGEISEISPLIKEECFDIAGFMVGYIKGKTKKVKKNDIIIAFKSNGVHSNGFSLIRKLYKDKKIDENIFKKTLSPTEIYYEKIDNLFNKNLIKKASNITGGGIVSNISRIVDDNLILKIDYNSIPKQEIFEILSGFIEKEEMYNIFNMGAGFCVIADKKDVDNILKLNEDSFVLGEIGC